MQNSRMQSGACLSKEADGTIQHTPTFNESQPIPSPGDPKKEIIECSFYSSHFNFRISISHFNPLAFRIFAIEFSHPTATQLVLTLMNFR